MENAACVCARADPLYGLAVVLAVLSYERWREARRGVPVMALVLFEAALLSKEAAVSLPVVLLLLAARGGARSIERAEWRRGLAPFVAVAAAHFAVLRPWALSGPGLESLRSFGIPSLGRLATFSAGAVLPARIERIESRPWRWSCLALGLVSAAILVAAVRARQRRTPAQASLAAAIFCVLLAPSLISFQERFFFLPSAVSAFALASLFRAMGPRLGVAGLGVLLTFWLVSLGDHWASWRVAGRASDSLLPASSRRAAGPACARPWSRTCPTGCAAHRYPETSAARSGSRMATRCASWPRPGWIIPTPGTTDWTEVPTSQSGGPRHSPRCGCRFRKASTPGSPTLRHLREVGPSRRTTRP